MFELRPWHSGALITTALSLPIGVKSQWHSDHRDERALVSASLLPPAPSSEGSAGLLNSYLGDFLAWTGEQLAHLGQGLFPSPTIKERHVIMQEARQSLKGLFREALTSETAKSVLHATLTTYLRQGIALTHANSLLPRVWLKGLSDLHFDAKRAGDIEAAQVLGAWKEELKRIIKKETITVREFFNEDTSPVIYETPFELSSLDGTNGFQINGMATNDWSGTSVSSAGDVNGDGYADLIIGAIYASPDNNYRAGASYVIFGQASFEKTFELYELNGINGFQINGITENDRVGYSVSAAGDVNKDGYDDIIIGAYNASPNGRVGAGESYLIFGQSNFEKTFELSQLNGTNGFQINGISKNDGSGVSVSSAGDVNKDGYDDFIIGTYTPSESYVIFGQSYFNKTFELSELNGTNGFQINGISAGDRFGRSVSGAGDVNKDGYADLIIGAPDADPNGIQYAGESYVVFGQSSFNKTFEMSELNGVNGFQINGIATNDFSGISVSAAGDVNKDCYDDLIIGATMASPDGRTYAGESYVIFGQPRVNKTFALSELNGTNGFQINGITAYDQSGFSVSGVDDVNGDGYADLIIGARYASSDGRAKAGQSYVVFGQSSFEKTFELSQLNGMNGFQINGIAGDDRSGSSVRDAGDVNGDGISDFIIGAYLASPNGRSRAGESYVVFGGMTHLPSPSPGPSPSPTSTPKPTPSPSPAPEGLSIKELVGLIAGGLGLFAIGAGVTAYSCCKKSNEEEEEPLLTGVGEEREDEPRDVYATQRRGNIQHGRG